MISILVSLLVSLQMRAIGSLCQSEVDLTGLICCCSLVQALVTNSWFRTSVVPSDGCFCCCSSQKKIPLSNLQKNKIRPKNPTRNLRIPSRDVSTSICGHAARDELGGLCNPHTEYSISLNFKSHILWSDQKGTSGSCASLLETRNGGYVN